MSLVFPAHLRRNLDHYLPGKVLLHPADQKGDLPSIGFIGMTAEGMAELDRMCLHVELWLRENGADIGTVGRTASGRMLEWVFRQLPTEDGQNFRELQDPLRSILDAVDAWLESNQAWKPLPIFDPASFSLPDPFLREPLPDSPESLLKVCKALRERQIGKPATGCYPPAFNAHEIADRLLGSMRLQDEVVPRIVLPKPMDAASALADMLKEGSAQAALLEAIDLTIEWCVAKGAARQASAADATKCNTIKKGDEQKAQDAPDDPTPNIAGPKLTEREELILVTMHAKGITSEAARISRATIADLVLPRASDSLNSLNRAFNALANAGLTETKDGRDGGTWLSHDGAMIAGNLGNA